MDRVEVIARPSRQAIKAAQKGIEAERPLFATHEGPVFEMPAVIEEEAATFLVKSTQKGKERLPNSIAMVKTKKVFPLGKEVLTFDEVIAKYSDQFTQLGLEAPSKTFLKHIKNSHIQGGTKAIAGKKSIFNVGENALELALDTFKYGKEIKKGEIVHDFGRIIGIDKFGNPTSKIKVYLTENLKSINSVCPK